MKLYPAGTVIFAKSGMSAALGRVVKLDRPAYVVSHLAALRPTGRYDSNFLAHWLASYGTHKLIKDPAYPSIRLADIAELNVPDLPLGKQKRIAAILDQADAIHRQRLGVVRQLGRLRDALLDDACSGSDRPVPLSSLFSDIRMGPFGSLLHKADYVSGGIPLINPMHIAGGRIFPDPDFAVSAAKADQLKSYQLAQGDIVIGRRGEMGRAALVLEQHSGMMCGTGSMRLRVRPVALPEFMADFLTHPRLVRELENAATGVTMLNLNSSSFDKIMTRFPPLHAQERYARIKAEIEKKRDLFAASIERAAALSASLQHRAFRGEL